MKMAVKKMKIDVKELPKKVLKSKKKVMGNGMKTKTVPKKSISMKMVEPSSCLVGTQRYNGTMVDMALPASRPLISLGNSQYGDLYIR